MAGVDPETERIALLIDGLKDLPFEEREARIAELSEDDRNAVWAVELEGAEEAEPDDVDELGGEA